MDKASGAMIGGGFGGALAANTDKIDKAAQSDAMREAVNLLHAPLVEVGNVFIAANTLFSFVGCGVALYGLYKTINGKK